MAYQRILNKESRTATESVVIENNDVKIGTFVLVVESGTGAATLTLTIEGYDEASRTYYPILTALAVSTNDTFLYKVGVGVVPITNVSTDELLPDQFKVTITKNNATAVVYSLGLTGIE